MTSFRHSELSFHRIFAELAAAPVASEEAFMWCVDDIASENQTGGPPRKSRRQAFWEALEGRLLSSHPGISVDEVSALRDFIWFDAPDAGSKLNDGSILQYLHRLASQLLEDQGNRLAPRLQNHVALCTLSTGNHHRFAREVFAWLRRSMPSDLLAAAYGGIKPIVPLSELTHRILERQFAEMHLHLGASFTFEQIWPITLSRLADRHFGIEEFKSRNASFDHGRGLALWILRAAVLRQHLSRFLFLRHSHKKFTDYWSSQNNSRLSKGSLDYFRERAFVFLLDPRETASEQYCQLAFQRLKDIFRMETASCDRSPVEDLVTLPAVDPIYPMTRTVDGKLLPEQVFIGRACEYIRTAGSKDVEFRKLFWQIQRIRCLFHQFLTQQQGVPGLVWFTRFYRRISPARRGKITTSGKICLAAETGGFGNGLMSLEVRVQPEENRSSLLREVSEIADTARALHIGLQEADAAQNRSLANIRVSDILAKERAGPRQAVLQQLQSESVLFQKSAQFGLSSAMNRREFVSNHAKFELGIVLHFIKERERGSNPLHSGSQEFLSSFGLSSHENPTVGPRECYRYEWYCKRLQRQARAICSVLEQYPLSLQWIRGIDICNDELSMPTWLFASVFQMVIDSSKRVSERLSRDYGWNVPPIRPTCHVGEDFVHLLTGLRRIDEAIEMLGLCEGCRIGHGLALGTDPTEWTRKAGPVAIDKMTRLHDLVWEWSVMDQLTDGESYSRAHFVQTRAQKLIDELFEHWETVRGKRLKWMKSVQRKPNLHELVQLRKDLADPELLRDVGYPDKPPALSIANFEHFDRRRKNLFRYLVDPVLFEKGKAVEIVPTAAAGKTLCAIQNGLRSKVANRGIFVEINPSSNEIVAALPALTRHPAWRLSRPQYSDETSEVALCIGSDDPLVFSTDLRNEYQRVFDTLTDMGYSDRDIRDWGDRIRTNSLDTRVTLPEVSFRPVRSLYVMP